MTITLFSSAYDSSETRINPTPGPLGEAIYLTKDRMLAGSAPGAIGTYRHRIFIETSCILDMHQSIAFQDEGAAEKLRLACQQLGIAPPAPEQKLQHWHQQAQAHPDDAPATGGRLGDPNKALSEAGITLIRTTEALTDVDGPYDYRMVWALLSKSAIQNSDFLPNPANRATTS